MRAYYLILRKWNILDSAQPKSPFQAQPADRSQISQLLLPSQIQRLWPVAHGQIQRHGAEPYSSCLTTLRA